MIDEYGITDALKNPGIKEINRTTRVVVEKKKRASELFLYQAGSDCTNGWLNTDVSGARLYCYGKPLFISSN